MGLPVGSYWPMFQSPRRNAGTPKVGPDAEFQNLQVWGLRRTDCAVEDTLWATGETPTRKCASTGRKNYTRSTLAIRLGFC